MADYSLSASQALSTALQHHANGTPTADEVLTTAKKFEGFLRQDKDVHRTRTELENTAKLVVDAWLQKKAPDDATMALLHQQLSELGHTFTEPK